MKKREKNIAIGVLAVVVLAIVVTVIVIANSGGPFEFSWPKGTEYVYALDYQNKNATKILSDIDRTGAEAPSITARMHLVADLVLTSHGEKKGVYLLEARFENISRAELTMLGQDLDRAGQPLKEALSSGRGLLRVKPDGRVKELSFPKGAPSMFSNTLQTILAETQVVVSEPESTSWRVDEVNMHGLAAAEYAWQGAASDLALAKTRDRYKELNALAESPSEGADRIEAAYKIALDAAGHLSSYEGKERIVAGGKPQDPALDVDTTVSLVLKSTGQAKDGLEGSQRFAGWIGRRIGEIVISDEAESRALDRQIAGMSVERMKRDLVDFGAAGRMPNHNAWIWQSVGVLEKDPASARDLIPTFNDAKVGSRGREMILDLLVSVSHPEAQQVARELLESDQAKSDPKYYDMIQRLGFFKNPDEATIDLTEKLFAESKGATDDAGRDVHYASAYTLGSVANELLSNGDVDDASRLNSKLTRALGAADTPEDRQRYLRALGNVGAEKNVSIIAAHAADESVAVRRAVAYSLRKTQTPESEEIVLGLAGDREVEVQKEALLVLRKYDLSHDHLARVDDLLGKDEVQSRSYGTLASLLGDQLEDGKGGELASRSKQMLVDLASRTDTAGKLRKRIIEMLEQ